MKVDSDLEVDDRDMNEGTVPLFSWKDRGRPLKTSVGLAGSPSEIRTGFHANTCQKFRRQLPLSFCKGS